MRAYLLSMLCVCLLFTVSVYAQTPAPEAIEIEFNTSAEGDFTADQLTAVYYFEAQAGDVVRIVGSAYPFLASVTLLGSDRELIERQVPTYGPEVYIGELTLHEDGRYWIMLVGTEPGQYTLQLSLRETPLLETTGNSEYLYPGVDTLDFILEGVAGDVVDIFGFSEDFDIFIELQTLDGTTLITDDDSAGNLNARIKQFTFPDDGTYRLLASSYDEGGAGSFSLQMREIGETWLDYGMERHITLTTDNSIEYFEFYGSEGDVIALTWDNPDDAAADIIITDPRLEIKLVDTRPDQRAFHDVSEQIVLQNSGWHSIMVQASEQDTEGSVSFRLTRVDTLSLDGGGLSLFISSKNPVQQVSFMGWCCTSSDYANIRIATAPYQPMPRYWVFIEQSGSTIGHYSMDDLDGISGLETHFSISIVRNDMIYIRLELLSDGPARFYIEHEVVHGEG